MLFLKSKHLTSIALTLTALVLFSCHGKKTTHSKLETYTVINPIQADSSYTQEYVAEIQSIQNVELRARANGFLEHIYVDEGKSVQKGQLLFSLSSGEYTQEIAKAKAQLAAAEAELRKADLDINDATLLTKNNVVAMSELEFAKAKREAVLAGIEEAKANINIANINLNFTQIRAPFGGVISRIPNKVGALVEEGTLLTTISDNSEVFAYFNVSETSYLNLIMARKSSGNKKVQLELANGALFSETGIIETIDGEIDRNTGNLSFRARFSNPDKVLKHGSTGKVLIKNMLTNAILIPQQSTFEVQENLYVYVLDKNNHIRQRQILPKTRLSNMYVIKKGLSITDQVLYEGVQLVKEGEKIIPILKTYSEITQK